MTETLEPASIAARSERSAYAEATPPNGVCATCRGPVMVRGYYDDYWRSPITMSEFRIEDANGIALDGGLRLQGMPSFGRQDGDGTEGLENELGYAEFNDAQRGGVVAELLADEAALLEAQELSKKIKDDLRALAMRMETSLQHWIREWESDGWWGAIGTFFEGVRGGVTAWWNGEGEFWSAVGDWIAGLPDAIGNTWDSMTDGARALWENRDRIVGMIQALAEGAVNTFEQGIEALADIVSEIPDLNEVAGLLQDLVRRSAEWSGAMIEVATRTDVLRVMAATSLGVLMLVPPNFWAEVVGQGIGFLIPEAIISVVFLLIAAFTGGSGGAALAARLTAFAARVTTQLTTRAARAGRVLGDLFSTLIGLVEKLTDLVKSLLKGRRERRAGTTDAEIEIERSSAVQRVPPKRKPWERQDLDEEWYDAETGELRWPPNDGFGAAPTQETLRPGTRIDRFSGRTGLDDTGRYLSPEGTDFGSRALPYDPSTQQYAVYEVVQDLPVSAGQAAPWFGEVGGATQYMLDRPLNDLINNGFIRQVYP
ncbi:TNT domain-containing protein [Tritonibacter mobilis]|uniref:TNT domain-containing protein n=1 Tax=Tritonibacter mobilis TaxID=379347 RepID=UPI000806C9C5|nr:TNT domain-containing protein [Tritonibacter mobilis]GLP88535.1 hypothetical protein GCM10007921_40980 [Tritonibacter mobilis]SDX82015.1 Protein of unknown function [Tritonibacter mobilis]